MTRDGGAPGVRSERATIARAAAMARQLVRRVVARWRLADPLAAGSGAAATRWAVWARSLASRFGMARRLPGRLARTFGRRAAAARTLLLVERILERVRAVSAPPLLVSLGPRLAFGGRDAAWPEGGRRVRPALAGGERRAHAFVEGVTASSTRVRGRTAPALERALARRRGFFGSSPVESVAAPATKRLEGRALVGAGRAPVERLFARTRIESPADRAASRTLHRPARPAVETPTEAPLAGRRRTAAPVPAAPSANVVVPSRELDRLTEQVVRRIDRRMTAWRERTGRTR